MFDIFLIFAYNWATHIRLRMCALSRLYIITQDRLGNVE